MLRSCSKTYCCFDVTTNKYLFSGEDLNKSLLEQSADGPSEKNRRVLDKKLNITSINKAFRTNNQAVASYEQIKKGLSYFYQKTIVESDGIHTQPFNL